MSKLRLLARAVAVYILTVLALGALLFLPAGTLHYPGGQRLMALLLIPMLVLGVVLFFRAPALLEKRLNSREKEAVQAGVIAASALMFLLAFVLAGLDFRFGLTHVPDWLTYLACALLLVSYALYAEVMRENAYLSRTVEVQENQRVVDTGLYGVVRHPMYAVTLVLFLSMPLVLGSWLSLAVLLAYPFIIAARIRDEERVLIKGLPGYAEYTQRVRWRLIPFLW
ncbi:MAG: isoprenylcysteine carboxylmethyltransferase family protein [Clostridia bacterium]|nr:isoprenylcysteine carboxylmethyltransferase family protein [Clostridia bacterium]